MSGHDEDARTAAREDQARDERDAARYADEPPRLRARLTTAGGLSVLDLGHRVRVENLHQPGTDWDAPKVTAEGVLIGYHVRGGTTWSEPTVRLILRPEQDADLRLYAHYPVTVL